MSLFFILKLSKPSLFTSNLQAFITREYTTFPPLWHQQQQQQQQRQANIAVPHNAQKPSQCSSPLSSPSPPLWPLLRPRTLVCNVPALTLVVPAVLLAGAAPTAASALAQTLATAVKERKWKMKIFVSSEKEVKPKKDYFFFPS